METEQETCDIIDVSAYLSNGYLSNGYLYLIIEVTTHLSFQITSGNNLGRSNHWSSSIKKAVLIGKRLCWSPSEVFSCEYYEMFKSTYFEEHLITAASA